MNIFDKNINEIMDILSGQDLKSLNNTDKSWEITEKNTFLMDRDTRIELGGYPKESINILVPSSAMTNLTGLNDGIYCIGDSSLMTGKDSHISFGKLILIETEALPEKDYYSFTQSELLTDSRIRMKDIMLRQSPVHYNTNLRIGKKAFKAGFNAEVFGTTVYNAFRALEHVSKVTVILIFGDSPLYKDLLSSAERIKEVTLTLNHIFDGINMDCGHCDVREICNEVEGMRELHKKLSR